MEGREKRRVRVRREKWERGEGFFFFFFSYLPSFFHFFGINT